MKTKETLKNKVDELINNSDYKGATDLVAKEFNIKLDVKFLRTGSYFPNDKKQYSIFKCVLKKDKKQYSFTFGQSIVKIEAPNMYDILACLTKYDVGTFDDFCGEFGYNNDSRNAEKIYKAVVKEYKAVNRLFTDAEIEALSYIN